MNATSMNDSAEQAVRAALARFNAAAKVGDAAALAALLTEDLMYSHSNAKVENKAECIAALVRSNIDFRERESWTVQVYNGGTCALVHGKMDAYNPGDIIVPLHFLMTWVKVGEEWLLAGRHTTKLPS
jgi:ketosteroid isomerase-like protein